MFSDIGRASVQPTEVEQLRADIFPPVSPALRIIELRKSVSNYTPVLVSKDPKVNVSTRSRGIS